ncbi:hypothetical protein KQH91_03945 [Lactobacillus johnsonii]|uniref:hypothetical protein n=1 Tax=Lactobacillus johnsonii TaxID=33959 RepID=UPI001C1241BE|nr:hypothetical protein [Lactobacillus johnsonii]MBU5318668.1 hypothetical protein [Lactobacillus johnsonii]
MRVTKLVIGILMIVYSVWLFIQGLLGGFLGIIAEKNMVEGIIGVLLCGLFMASGIVYVSTENSDGLGGDIASLAMMIVAGILGIIGGFYAGLIWTGILALVIGIGFFVWHLKTR